MTVNKKERENMLKNIKKIIAIVAIIGMGVILFHLLKGKEVENKPIDDCKFSKMITNEDSSFSEPSAGTYEYVLYTTSQGIELWKCDRNSH